MTGVPEDASLAVVPSVTRRETRKVSFIYDFEPGVKAGDGPGVVPDIVSTIRLRPDRVVVEIHGRRDGTWWTVTAYGREVREDGKASQRWSSRCYQLDDVMPDWLAQLVADDLATDVTTAAPTTATYGAQPLQESVSERLESKVDGIGAGVQQLIAMLHRLTPPGN